MQDWGPVNYLGGNMYGDGVYVVVFENVRSAHAPIRATVTNFETGVAYRLSFDETVEMNVRTARRVIALVRHNDGAMTFDEAMDVCRSNPR